MGIFCWQTCQKKKECESWFVGDEGLIQGCKSAATASNGEAPSSKEAYLTSLGLGQEQINQFNEENQKNADKNQKTTLTIIAIISVLVAIAIVVLLIKKLK